MMKALNVYLLSLIFAGLMMSSCNNTQHTFTDTEGNEFETNKVYPNVSGVSGSGSKFSIYFPDAYTSEEKLPVLVLLDPHAQGEIPVSKYATIANKYNYVLLASNQIKNGLSSNASDIYIKDLVKNIKQRFKIDEKRMFIGGFSGGAKLAVLSADKMPEFIGALACGGSIPFSFDKEPHYYYVGIVGNQDFNYLEMLQSFRLFDQYGFDYTSVTFDGGHTWPSKESFELGLMGFEFYSSKIGRTALSEEWKTSVYNQLNDSVMLFRKQSESIKEYEALQQLRRWFYGVSQVKEVNKRIAIITRSNDFRTSLSKKQALVRQEVQLRQEYIRAIETQDFDWWKTEISKMSSIDASNSEAYFVKQRLLNYVSMASFLLIKSNLNDSDFDGAFEKIKIYELVDENNPDVYLMYSKYYLLQGETNKMKQYYSKAQQKLTSSLEAYAEDIFWEDLLKANS